MVAQYVDTQKAGWCNMATKNAGAGRGFVNPQRTDEPDETYVTPKQRYEMEKDMQAQREMEQNEAGYKAASEGMGKKKGGKIKHYASAAAAVKAAEKRGDKSITVKFGHASKRADGIAERGHTKGRYL